MSRQEYLRQQRDKIVEIKKKTRAKQLQETVAARKTTSTGRPSSAQIAQKLLESGPLETKLEHTNGDGEVNAALQLRKTLAKRLRSEKKKKK